MNLLTETINMLASINKSIEDIIFIGSRDQAYSCTWQEFAIIANKEYDEDYGTQQVAIDLIIAFGDGSTMDRHDYDGSERWYYHPCFEFDFSAPHKPISKLITTKICWNSLEEINKESE